MSSGAFRRFINLFGRRNKSTGCDHHETKEKKRNANENWILVIWPESSTIKEALPSVSKIKKPWTNDIGMFFVTLAGVIAACIYAAIAAWQACLTREGNEINHQALIVVQRAFIYPLYNMAFEVEGPGLYGLNPHWSNSGNTAATGIVGIQCIAVGRIVPDPVVYATGKPKFSRRIMIPHQDFASPNCEINQAQMELLKSKTFVLAYVMSSKYKDAFGAEHFIEKCSFLHGIGPPIEKDGITTLSISGTPCEAHNCVDDECQESYFE